MLAAPRFSGRIVSKADGGRRPKPIREIPGKADGFDRWRRKP